MNLDNIKAVVTSRVARQVLVTQKHSPKILFVAGTIGVVSAAVLACRATLKLDNVLTQAEKQLTEIDIDAKVLDEDQVKKRKIHVQTRTVLEITKLYAPAVGLGALSIGALTGSHFVLNRRNSAAMATVAVLQKGYDQYRERVRTELGADKDREFAYGATNQNVVIAESLDGKKVTRKEKVVTDPQIGGSPYAVVFDERSSLFSKEPGRNRDTILMLQSYANDRLRVNGYLFLNEVYGMLKLPRTKAGQIVGWVHRRDNEPKNGDNFVTFGLSENEDEIIEAFLDGKEKYAVLDFNVDGPILELI